MKRSRKLILGVALAALCLCTNLHASDLNLSPLPGTPLRMEILDALRHEVKRIHGLDVVFVVRSLKVKDGWVWVHALPQSPDASSRYEDVSALLQLQDGAWTVVEVSCGEEEDRDCLHEPEYFSGLQKRFPGAPTVIFPNRAHGLTD